MSSGPAVDRVVVEQQLGRPPRGEVAVVARCPFGLPLVIATPSSLEDGTPFPTHYYLTCPVAIRAIGSLESSGLMYELNDRLQSDSDLAREYADAHDRYRIDRDGSLEGRADSAGGMPGRVKCLHALYAHEVAAGNPIGAIARARIEPLACDTECVIRDETKDGALQRVEGHPGFRRRRL